MARVRLNWRVTGTVDDDIASLAQRRFRDQSADPLKGVFPWTGEIVVNHRAQEPKESEQDYFLNLARGTSVLPGANTLH